ncbi:Cell division protein FtsA [bacterium HR17]|uniref:Cell division protein FtsA n=1 Tax=Candidatus Fervidibacter japonicus TaxID=2035412 RepID=A0A2H5XF42_9BACT|nr:Cell division protein FtsA [bacterium HR17]
MPNSVLGINMGNHTIKVVELVRRGSTFAVQNLLIAPTQDAIVSGEVIQPDVVGQIVKGMLQAAGVRTRKAVIAVGGQTGVIVRVTELPKMTRRELMQAIPLEIERHLPFQAGTAVQAYTLLKDPEEVGESEQIPVLFAAAREDLVNAYLMALQEAGLSPLGVEVEPLALARAVYAAQGFGMRDGREDQINIVVNIGHEGTEISFLEGTKLIFTRLVPSGGRHFTEDLRDALGVSMDEAERLKVEQGTAWVEHPTPAPPPAAAPTGLETQVLPPTTPSPPAAEPVPFELPTAESAAPPTIAFDLPTEPSPPSQPATAPTLDFSLEFEPTPPSSTPSEPAAQLPSLEFTPSAQQEPSLTPLVGETSVGGAEWLPTPPAEAPPLPITIHNAISNRLLDLAGEIARSVEFLASQRPNLTVQRIYLVGGGALLKDLDRFLENQLGVPVERLNPFAYMDVAPVAGRLGRDYIEQTAPIYAVAVGLALWAYL